MSVTWPQLLDVWLFVSRQLGFRAKSLLSTTHHHLQGGTDGTIRRETKPSEPLTKSQADVRRHIGRNEASHRKNKELQRSMPAETFQTAENSITCMLATPWRGKGGNLLSAPHEDREPQRPTTSHKCFKPKRPPAHLVLRHTRMWPDQRVEPGPKSFNRVGTGRTATLGLGPHPPFLVVGSPPPKRDQRSLGINPMNNQLSEE